MWAGVWMSVQQGKWRVPSWGDCLSFSARSKGGGLRVWAHKRSPPSRGGSWHQNIRQVWRKREWARLSGKKRKFIKGKTRGWLTFEKNQFPPFLTGFFLYPANGKFSEGVVNFQSAARVLWSHRLRSGIRWWRSLEKVGASRENRKSPG